MSQTNIINKDECWLWGGTIDRNGYAIILGGPPKGMYRYYGHRLMYEIYRGKIPKGLVLDHLCRVPRCVNPEHLEAVTQMENVRRGKEGRISSMHCPNGHLLVGTSVYFDKDGFRRCRPCKLEYSRRAYAKTRLKRIARQQNSVSDS